MLAEIGGAAVLAETTEIFGAEHLLVQARAQPGGSRKTARIRQGYKQYLNRFGGSFDDNPSPGNKEGGLYQHPREIAGRGGQSRQLAADGRRGLCRADRLLPVSCFMNTPGYDPVSLTGLAAGGCNLIAFTTGRGSAIGFPIDPRDQDRHQQRTPTAAWRTTWMSTPARIADGENTVQQVGREIFDLMLRGGLRARKPAPNVWGTRNSCRGASAR